MKQTSWFRDAVVYQLYIRSFYDSNGDGVGDLRGVIEKLNVIESLGVNALWLSPFCASPNEDNGYDVSDYRSVAPEFGTLDELEELIAKAHERKIRVLMDFVVNHTSDQHPWFQEAKASRSSPFRNWYYWADDRQAGPPNNWDSYFGGPAWSKSEETGQWYLHHFLPSQPDLNWENHEVRREMFAIARWWLEKGIDGFRLDAVHHIGKPQGLPDAPPHLRLRQFKNTKRTHLYLKEFRQTVLEPFGAFAIGETGGTTPSTALQYTAGNQELDAIFHFDQFFLSHPQARDFVNNHHKWYRTFSRHKAWDTAFFSNHDQGRHLSLWGDDRYLRLRSAQFFAAVLLTSWGTPFVYQGEELGMGNAGFQGPQDFQDKASLRRYQEALQQGQDPVLALAKLLMFGRDNARTPYSWSSESQAGFTSGEAWLKPAYDFKTVNWASQQGNGDSVWEFYRKLIQLRHSSQALRHGKWSPWGKHPHVYAIQRRYGSETMALVGNWSHESVNWVLPRSKRSQGKWAVLASNYPGQKPTLAPGKLSLRPWEVYLLSPE